VTALGRQGDALCIDDVPLATLARTYGTPLYVYSATVLEHNLRAYQTGFGDARHRICYSVKASGNLAIIGTLVAAGAGCDIVSVGELERALLAGCPAERIVFSGVGKRADELEAALAAGVGCINVESAAELELVDQVARGLGLRAPIALRVNPDVDARTHPYIATGLRTSKFGVDIADAPRLYAQARRMAGVAIRGVACHIGSQLTDLAPLHDALARVVPLVRGLAAAGDPIAHVDVGGGLGIGYGDTTGTPPTPADYARTVRAALAPLGDLGLTIVCEPGRSIVGAAGVLVARVLHEKPGPERPFLVLDAAMTELIRPALYEAVHEIVADGPAAPTRAVDVVGPVCESGDVLGRERQLPALQPGALVAILGAGAYGMSMASNYNARPRAAEVLVRGQAHTLVRRRETLRDLVRGECLADGRRPQGVPE
jgi:diaminopimelate decarboxylase